MRFHPAKPCLPVTVENRKAYARTRHTFTDLEIHPVRYNPARGEIEYVTSIELSIDFEGGDVAETRRLIDRYTNGFVSKIADDMFLNHGAFESRHGPVGSQQETSRTQARHSRSSACPQGPTSFEPTPRRPTVLLRPR